MVTQIMENIGQKLANIRKESGLNQKELAALLKRSSSYISRVESGEREPNPSLINAWLKVCKVKSGWSESKYLEELQKYQRYTNNSLSTISGIRAQDFFTENYVENSAEFRTAFETASELSMIGMSQLRMITSYTGQIQRIVAEGGKTRFILCNPDSIVTEMAIKRENPSRNIELAKQEHWNAIDRLISISKAFDYTNNFSIKFIDLLPTYTMYGFDLQNPVKSRIFIWINIFHEPSGNRPGFSLSFAQDKYWTDFFITQFERLWNWNEAKDFDFSRGIYQK